MAAAKHLTGNVEIFNKQEKVTLLVPQCPHGDLYISEYNNPAMWTGGYSWLFPYGVSGPEDDTSKTIIKHWYVGTLAGNQGLSQYSHSHVTDTMFM